MTVDPANNQRVLSGMRPTGKIHLGHYHGVLKNWLQLQHEYQCFFFIADWHALTTDYESPEIIEANIWDMVIDWLAVGINPSITTLFIQSRIPEHAELHLLLSMLTPLSWLERVPTYKDQQEKLHNKELSTYGFLGYPLLQSADILVYKAGYVPVGDDQVAHVELTREVARRFNYLYGREPGYEDLVKAAIKKMGKKNSRIYNDLRKQFQEKGNTDALAKAQAFVAEQQNISLGDRERLMGYLEGGGKIIFPEPKALLTKAPKVPGLDGQKMSKSYGNAVTFRDPPDEISEKINKMPTDPARVRRNDPGDPDKCPVWQLHKLYSKEDVLDWVQEGCRKAKIGCLDCKKPVADAILEELAPIRERTIELTEDPSMVRKIISDGCDAAREVAHETLEDVRHAMHLIY